MHATLRAVLFDLDGTLIDSLPDLTAAVARMLARHGRPPLGAEAVRGMVGDGAITLVERAFVATGGPVSVPLPDLLDAFMADYEPRSAETTRPWPGVVETLDWLRGQGLALAVCTNKPSRAAAEVLESLDLARFFDAVVGPDEVPAIKPDPAHVQAVLTRLGVAPAQAVMVGDSYNDVAAGKGAGLRTVVLSFGYAHGPVADLGADHVIDDFLDLPEVLGLDGPAPELRGLIPAFRAEMERDRAGLSSLLAAGDRAALAAHVHAMRGKCAMFGQNRLADQLGGLEQAAASESSADLAGRIEAIGRRLDRLG